MTMIPHFKLPLRLDRSGSFAVLEQDSLDEVAQCVEVLIRTPEGSRIELPRYGVPDLVFQLELDKTVILGEIERWEPRAAVTLRDAPDRLDDLLRNLTIRTTTRREVT